MTMAGKNAEKKTGGQAKACPTFELRADQAGHFLVLLNGAHAKGSLTAEDRERLETTIREFELWEDAQRNG
jgi:hypothetical protein